MRTFARGISKKYIGAGVDDLEHKGVGSMDWGNANVRGGEWGVRG